jgi:hypothetical protein
VIARLSSHLKIWRKKSGLTIEGSSPPSVFVGRIGYPYVNIGPLAANYSGDTSLLDAPDKWLDKTIYDIIDFRSQLFRGMYRVNVKKAIVTDKILDRTRELSLSQHYAETEMKLKNNPRQSLRVDADVQPIGPTAPLEKFELGYVKWNQQMEKAHYDSDLKASLATKMLFKQGVPVYEIQRAFSMGSFGIEKNRKLVPTRWSITAVDDIISKDLVKNVKDFPSINRYEVYESENLGNRFLVLLTPDSWSYEAYEAWYPGTVWNPLSQKVAIITDWEGRNGRRAYASMGGCYYSGRLAVLEHMMRTRRQSRAFIIREAYPDYILPIGVWQVRENVRNAMNNTPLGFDSMEEALNRLSARLTIPLEHWMSTGSLLRNTIIQKKITEFL